MSAQRVSTDHACGQDIPQEDSVRKVPVSSSVDTAHPDESDRVVRLRYVVLAGGSLITFKIKKKQAFHERKKVFSLFGSYCYSGQLAQDELHEAAEQDAFASHPRVYHDGLQVGVPCAHHNVHERSG